MNETYFNTYISDKYGHEIILYVYDTYTVIEYENGNRKTFSGHDHYLAAIDYCNNNGYLKIN